MGSPEPSVSLQQPNSSNKSFEWLMRAEGQEESSFETSSPAGAVCTCSECASAKASQLIETEQESPPESPKSKEKARAVRKQLSTTRLTLRAADSGCLVAQLELAVAAAAPAADHVQVNVPQLEAGW